jgi:pyruvate dehydrogenase E1 component beta subunit
MLHVALAAADQLAAEGIETEVVNLRTLRPLDVKTMAESVSRTHHAVVVQEQWKPFGAAAEIAMRIYEEVFDQLDAPIERVTGADVPMPYARNLELAAVPHESTIIEAVHKTLGKK